MHLPACQGRRAARLPRLGTWQSLWSRGLPGSWQAVGVGQPSVPGALRLKSRKQAEGELVATHSGRCHGIGQLLSLAAGKQPGWHGDRLHLTQPNQDCWDFSPQNLSSGRRFCPRISYPLSLWLSKNTASRRKVHEVTISAENSHTTWIQIKLKQIQQMWKDTQQVHLLNQNVDCEFLEM